MIAELLTQIAHDEPDIRGLWLSKVEENRELAAKFSQSANNIQKHPVKAEIARKLQNKLGRADYRVDISKDRPGILTLNQVGAGTVFAGSFEELIDWIDEAE